MTGIEKDKNPKNSPENDKKKKENNEDKDLGVLKFNLAQLKEQIITWNEKKEINDTDKLFTNESTKESNKDKAETENEQQWENVAMTFEEKQNKISDIFKKNNLDHIKYQTEIKNLAYRVWEPDEQVVLGLIIANNNIAKLGEKWSVFRSLWLSWDMIA